MLPPNTYKVDDFETIRQTIFDDALNSLSNRFPLENDKYRLTVEDLGYDSIPKYTTLQQKEAVQSDKTLSAKIKGRWTLYDKNTGKIVSQSSRKTIMDVPYMTERGTFIRNGTEMTLPIQMRLVPGVYARMTDSGEAKAHINVKPGSGSQLSITMNPANPVFKVTQGTRNYKLYPLLKHMGISDEYLMNAWGKDIYKANYDDFISGGGWYSAKTAAEENPYDEITKRVFRGDLDPLETEASLGKGYKTVDPDMMVAAASKLLRISKGEAESDNRDSLENQRFLMAPELIGERVRLDAGKVGQTLLWKISRSGDVNKIPAGALNKYINGLFTESRLAQAIEETNPLDAYMRATKVTRMGEGGISGVDTAPMSARLVHNTYKGFIDPTVSPECCANHLVMSNLGWVEISKVTEDTLVACLIDGKLEYHKPYKVVSYDFNGELYCYNATATAYEVTGNHRMWSRLDAFSDYTFEFAENIFNTHRIFWSGADTYTDDSKTEITIFANTPDETYHFKKPYVGKVYCLSVPGGLFYTKLPGKRPFWIGNSLRAGLDSAIALNAVKGKDGFMYTPMINAISGRREYVNSLVASKVPVAFSEYRDSTQKYIPAMVGNKIEYLPKANVKYFIPNGDSLFALSSNLIPLKSGIKAGRLLMAQKHQTQAVSLSSRMAPYVQTEHPGDNTISVEKSIGKLMGAVFSKGDGKVLSVTPDEMTVRYNDGTKETISLYNNYPLNRKSYYHNESRVKPGDIVKKGQVLASSNYTDENGVSALGTQLRTAWMPFKGENYLDAIIVSEDAAKKLSSEHLYHTGVDKDSTTTIDKNAYTSAFPTKFNKDQLATIDKDGIVKPGTTVKFGDPLILSYSKREATPGSLHRALVKDNVVTWEHEFPGYITDVVNSSKGVKVYTKAYLPLQTGDKCFSDDTDLLTDTGWKNIKDITLNDKIATLNPETNCFEYLYPDSLHKIPYNGPMYTIDTPQLKTCVTPYHNNFVQKRHSDHFELVKASDCFNKRVSFKKDGIWNGVDTPTFTWPNGTKVDMDSVLILLGLFIAGESITLDNSVYNYLNTYRDHIPAFIFDLSIRQQKLFFDCLLNKKSIFTTKYEQLADDIQRLCLHIGLTATIKAGSIYRVIILYNTTPIVNSAIYTNYNGYVYCPTMPKWNVVYSRRNGVPVWSGNCAARYANKGVTARVVPTSEMPIAADGKPIDVIFGPTGIVSRVNSAQLVEAMLGKVAAKTGKRYVLPGFMNENMVEFAKRELAQAGLTDREDLTDPTTGVTIPQITVGNSYIVKMHHTAESKGGARATGAYTMDELPGGQGHDGSKLLGNLILGAIIGHGSTEVLKDMKLVKGQKNTDFWRDFKLGRTPVMPSTPLIYDKFIASLQGAGINVHKEKNTTNIFALTNKDINDFAHAEVKNSDTYSANNMAPLPGGLFDPNIFGPNGTQWGYIKLDEPVLNPVMEDPIKLILGLTEADLEAVISGNKKLPNGLTGGLGLKKQLESINMKQAVQDALNDVKNATRTKRDKAVKKYRYLNSMLKHNAGPADFMLDKIPVIPPRFRRISQSGDLTMVADANYLYRALMDNQQDVRDARNAGLPEDMVGSGNLKIYKAFKAITGLSDPEDRKLQEKQISGLLKWVFGKGTPKCYDSETEILTENGWVKFPEYLDSTIKVATLNPSTDAFEWQTPTDIIHMPYSGDMIYTHTRYLDSMVTPNHNHYVSLRTGKGINSSWTPFAKEQASNLVDVVKRVRYKTAASKYIGSTPNTFDITPNANAFATFIGWYTAEGWIHTDNTIAYIAVKAHGRDESILTDLFDNNAFKYKRAYYTTKAAKVSPYGIKTPAGYEMVYFSFYSKELCQWLRENVGASCYTKRLSSEILGWSSEYLINVWEGFHAGDGEKRSGLITTNSKKTWQSRKSFTDRGNRACTVSKDLAESFVELGLKIGASVNYVKNKEVYRISVHAFDYSVAEYRHQTSKVPYDGMVHCVTVPNGLVFVRRNGRVLVSGNSGAYQRNVVGGSLDVAGRNVITPNASFRLDEIGLPKKEAWTLYQDFVIRRLVQNGMDPLVATKEVTNKTKLAEDALRQVVSERPVLATRAPALHKYSIMAFRPRLVESETLQLNPAIQKPFNADHDGDSQVGRVVIRFTQKVETPIKYTLDF